MNICQLYERGPVVLALFFDVGSCSGILDDLQRLSRMFPRVGFAAVAVKEDAASVARMVRSKRVSVPVGVDTDGRLAGLYTMVSCPQVTFLYPGGVVQSAPLLEQAHRSPRCARGSANLASRVARAPRWMPGRRSSGEPVRGWCEREVQQELPGLGLMFANVEVELGPLAHGRLSTPAVLGRLRELSNRWRGARAVNVRQESIPAAYRVFFRHIGLDPDVTRTPIEAAVLERMLDGGFLSEGLLADILTIALIDTAVPVWALDSDTVEGPLGIRLSRPDERLGRGCRRAPSGRWADS